MASGEASAVVATGRDFARPAAAHAQWSGWVWAALAVTILSGWFVVTGFSVTRELRIWDIAALRFGIGAVLLAPAILRRGQRPAPIAWAEGLVFALLWGVPFVLFVALGLKLTSATQAASIAPTLMPVFAGVFACAFYGERQGRVRWLGYGAIIVGLVYLVGAFHGLPSLAGIGALAAGAAMWAIYTLLFRRIELSAIRAAALICFWSTVIFLPAYELLGLSRFSVASPSEIALQAVYQGVLMSGVALFAYNRAVSLLGTAAATAIIALLPVVASALAIPVPGETPTPAECLSLAIMVLGVLFASRPVSPPIQQVRGE